MKTLASGEGLLAVSSHGRRARAQEREPIPESVFHNGINLFLRVEPSCPKHLPLDPTSQCCYISDSVSNTWISGRHIQTMALGYSVLTNYSLNRHRWRSRATVPWCESAIQVTWLLWLWHHRETRGLPVFFFFETLSSRVHVHDICIHWGIHSYILALMKTNKFQRAILLLSSSK